MKSVGAKDHADEPWTVTAWREVAEETGIRAGSLSRLGARERLRDLPALGAPLRPGRDAQPRACLASPCWPARRCSRTPREHRAWRWLPWQQAADACFSPSNAEAILQLPRANLMVSRRAARARWGGEQRQSPATTIATRPPCASACVWRWPWRCAAACCRSPPLRLARSTQRQAEAELQRLSQRVALVLQQRIEAPTEGLRGLRGMLEATQRLEQPALERCVHRASCWGASGRAGLWLGAGHLLRAAFGRPLPPPPAPTPRRWMAIRPGAPRWMPRWPRAQPQPAPTGQGWCRRCRSTQAGKAQQTAAQQRIDALAGPAAGAAATCRPAAGPGGPGRR
ncbi:MAG: hypothetical protein U1E77_09450 [Inhella sp.]